MFELTVCGENAIKITCEEAAQADVAYFAALRAHIRQYRPRWLEDVVAAEASVTVFYNILAIGYFDVKKQLRKWLSQFRFQADAMSEPLITLPVRYGGEMGEDLQWVADNCEMSVQEVIRCHQEATYTVTAVGFAPGFGYLKGLPKVLRLPRRTDPRLRVPAGAVAIAEQYSAIYPQQSPGGWHLIGYCEENLFDISLPKPALFKVGQQVRFISVD